MNCKKHRWHQKKTYTSSFASWFLLSSLLLIVMAFKKIKNFIIEVSWSLLILQFASMIALLKKIVRLGLLLKLHVARCLVKICCNTCFKSVLCFGHCYIVAASSMTIFFGCVVVVGFNLTTPWLVIILLTLGQKSITPVLMQICCTLFTLESCIVVPFLTMLPRCSLSFLLLAQWFLCFSGDIGLFFVVLFRLDFVVIMLNRDGAICVPKEIISQNRRCVWLFAVQ